MSIDTPDAIDVLAKTFESAGRIKSLESSALTQDSPYSRRSWKGHLELSMVSRRPPRTSRILGIVSITSTVTRALDALGALRFTDGLEILGKIT